MNVAIKKLSPKAALPTYANAHDAGMDLYALANQIIAPRQRALISTGIALAIPEGYVGLIWDKSGLATKNGLTTLAGVIDSGYRGEVQIAIYNTSDQPYQIEANKKIAQLLIQPIVRARLLEVNELSASARGAQGFGSSGV